MDFLRSICICAILMLGVVLSGCAKKSTATSPSPLSGLNTGATITLDLAQSLRVVEDGIRQANAAGVADTNTTAAILKVTTRINQAGLQVNTVLRSQTTLSPDQKISIKTLLDPIVTAIQNAVDIDVIKISNVNTQNQIKSGLLAMQLAIKSTLAAIGGN